MNDIVKNNYGSLKIAFPTMRGTYMLPCTLPIFNSLYPNVRLENPGVAFLFTGRYAAERRG